MNKHYVGVDPGKSGAIIVIYPDNNIRKFLIPKKGKEVDVHELNKMFESLNSINCHIVIEDVHAIFGSSAGATFSFGWVCGIIEGILVSNNLSFTKVQPKIWQKEMFQGVPEIRKPSKENKKGTLVKGKLDTKTMSIIASRRLFPYFSLAISERAKKDNDGVSDALLMAEYCRRKFK